MGREANEQTGIYDRLSFRLRWLLSTNDLIR